MESRKRRSLARLRRESDYGDDDGGESNSNRGNRGEDQESSNHSHGGSAHQRFRCPAFTQRGDTLDVGEEVAVVPATASTPAVVSGARMVSELPERSSARRHESKGSSRKKRRREEADEELQGESSEAGAATVLGPSTPAVSATSSSTSFENEDCGICLDKFKTRGRISCCEHFYCFQCIQKWSKSSNTCPQCKRRFECINKIDATGKSKKYDVKKADLRQPMVNPNFFFSAQFVLSDHLLMREFLTLFVPQNQVRIRISNEDIFSTRMGSEIPSFLHAPTIFHTQQQEGSIGSSADFPVVVDDDENDDNER